VPDSAMVLPQAKLVYTTGKSGAQALSSPWSTTWLLAADSKEAIGDA
jgi:hypothetical protein